MKKELTYFVDIPEGVNVTIERKTVIVKGGRGENKRLFHYPGVQITLENNKVVLHCDNASKKEKSMMGVFSSHISNMIKGVKQGFIYKLKICSGHFPINVEVKENAILISNFLGEKKPRIAKIMKGVNANIDGDIITLEGYDKELTGQSGANIEKATAISKRDRRVFQDGIFLIDKGGKIIE